MSLNQIAEVINNSISREFNLQGHGSGVEIETKITEGDKEIIIEGFTEKKYLRYVASGVSSSKIPFSGTGKKGGTSKYIEGLIAFARSKNMDNPKSAAFAIAYTQKKEGMPTQGSYRFSTTGQRTGFIEDGLKRNEKKINNEIDSFVGKMIDTEINEIFKRNEPNNQ